MSPWRSVNKRSCRSFAYEQTILNAVREVDTAIDAYAAQQNRLKYLAEAVTAARRAVTLATDRFDRGLIDSLNVIDAQRQEYAIEREYVTAQQAAAEQLVTLYKSLGGGLAGLSSLPAAEAAIAGRRGGIPELVDRRRLSLLIFEGGWIAPLLRCNLTKI